MTPVLSREAEEKLRRLEQEHAKMAAIHSLTEVQCRYKHGWSHSFIADIIGSGSQKYVCKCV